MVLIKVRGFADSSTPCLFSSVMTMAFMDGRSLCHVNRCCVRIIHRDDSETSPSMFSWELCIFDYCCFLFETFITEAMKVYLIFIYMTG